jgi:hypothetical protein
VKAHVTEVSIAAPILPLLPYELAELDFNSARLSRRMTVAYRLQYPAAQTGESPEEKQPGRHTKSAAGAIFDADRENRTRDSSRRRPCAYD